MITLSRDCLLFELTNGEIVPFSADMISVELAGGTSKWFAPEMASQAAKAVFYYFKVELKRQRVTAEEFATAMEKVLRGFKPELTEPAPKRADQRVIESDLQKLALEAGEGCELIFFPKLRDQLRHHLKDSPRVVRFRGLRACVKQIAGARKWSPRCRVLEEQIVGFLRECAGTECRQSEFALLVE
jgi:hypothetical protein